MYNRYFENDNVYDFEPVSNEDTFEKEESPKKEQNIFSAFSNIFDGLKKPQITTEMIILFVIAYFLLDGTEDNDIIIYVVILALLGF